jgi:hypothetical protein
MKQHEETAMVDEFRPIHGFRLSVADGAGQPGIFLLPVFPESVLDVSPNDKGGSSVAVRMSNGETLNLSVAQPPELVQELMRQCKALDQGIGSDEGRES